jgi:LDH2 family malate/lactate/ureidoglycolate dehydrogenase
MREDIKSRAASIAAAGQVSASDLAALAFDMFAAAGVSTDDSRIATDAVMWASLRGIESHGAVHMPLYLVGLLDKTIKSAPHITYEGNLPACRAMDADNGLGLVACTHALNAAIELARTFGLGAVSVRNSSHFGAAGYYAELAARHGMVAMAFSNASPALAPPGSREAKLGTNPIAAAFPVPDAEPIVMDMATTVVARSRIRQAKALGKPIPADWAFDSEGNPTTDPAKAVEGTLQAIGGPKGFGLSLMVELFCSALSDGTPGFDVNYENFVKRPSRISQFFIVMNPEGFAGSAQYGARARHIADGLLGAKRIDEAVAPRLPGARGHRTRTAYERDGIPVKEALGNALKQAAELLVARQLDQ